MRTPLDTTELSKLDKVLKHMKRYAERYSWDWIAVAAQAYQESALDQRKVSSAGAIGIMQLLPSTAAQKTINIKNIKTVENNIHAGVKYLNFIRENYFSDPAIAPGAGSISPGRPTTPDRQEFRNCERKPPNADMIRISGSTMWNISHPSQSAGKLSTTWQTSINTTSHTNLRSSARSGALDCVRSRPNKRSLLNTRRHWRHGGGATHGIENEQYSPCAGSKGRPVIRVRTSSMNRHACYE